jgi:hypothetical protein
MYDSYIVCSSFDSNEYYLKPIRNLFVKVVPNSENIQRWVIMFNLTEDKYLEIERKLPTRIFDLQHKVLRPNIDLLLAAAVHNSIENKKSPKTKDDVAAVCLRDSVDVACDVVYALRKANENLIWYREQHPEAPLKFEACRFTKFYVDDAALRLYAAAEHIANFIICFFNVSSAEIKPHRKSNASIASAVGKYMNTAFLNHDITKFINGLLRSDSWKKTMAYRNFWVHEQPPLIEGQGIVYERRSRLKKTENGYSVGLTLGDKPRYTIDSLLSQVTKAATDFVLFMDNLVTIWFLHIES